MDDKGNNLLPDLLAHKYVGNLDLLPFKGFTKPHSLILDVGEPYRGGPLHLLMHGEIEYFTATGMYAAADGIQGDNGDFEPRLLKSSIKVKIIADSQKMNHNALCFGIEAELWAQPLPLRLFLRTDIDLETGTVNVSEQGQGG